MAGARDVVRADLTGSLRRTFVTPEGVDLRVELGGAGVRAAAFLVDVSAMLLVLATATVVLGLTAIATRAQLALIVWLIGGFVLRNGWFVLFELGGRGATPGKRLMGLRVIARDGARLTASAVVARNAMREIELFLPLSFLATQTAEGSADAFAAIFALLWSGIFLFFPLFNHDRLRVGDMVAGTWVVQVARRVLASDLARSDAGARRAFPDAALRLYGEYELQALENVLRTGEADTMFVVAGTIRRKAGLPEDGRTDAQFLADYYAALCERLEAGLMLGRRRSSKHDASTR